MVKAREAIAVTGVACRFPGIADPAALWALLRSGCDALNAAGEPRAGTGAGGRLREAELFDATFFGMSPREAERLDPQHRLLLELSWEALEDAGVVPGAVCGTEAGVFVGLWTNDYEARLFADAEAVDFHAVQGTGRYAASGRVSHVLGLRGPSLTLDTGCSSSLVAVHLACRSLWSGESKLALAAGANVILEPHITRAYTRAGMLSADGRCRFGDAGARGYVRSDGAGVVVLKPLSQALADGDRVYAVILGGAVNNDGGASGSFGRPAKEGQEDLLRKAYADAGVDCSSVAYVEVHGTGTGAGDPVELGALGAVLCAGRGTDAPLLTGSLKTNVGHTESAAGIAGLIKVALSLHHGVIPPSLHFREPNPAVDWATLPLRVVREATPWPAGDERVAGVSSFGIGGTNAHIVMAGSPREAAQCADTDVTTTEDESWPLLFPISGRSSGAVRSLAEAYSEVLGGVPASVRPADLCHTAALHRSHHRYRAAVVATTIAELRAGLDAVAAGESAAGVHAGRSGGAPRVAFVFPGQGSQWAGMGVELMATEPAFDEALRAAAAAVSRHTGWSPVDVLTDDAALARIEVVQPALFAVQVALAALWRSWGIEPAALAGHSMGEVAAAHVAGALSLDEAARIICTRSALLRQVSGRGGMALVELSPEDAAAALRGREHVLSVAVANGPRSTVIAGDVDALDALLAELESQGVFCRPVRVDVASHSPQVDPLLPELAAALGEVAAGEAAIPMASTVTAGMVSGTSLDAAYWVRNLRAPVRFADAVATLAGHGCDAFIEVSPHPVLLPAIEQCLPGQSVTLAASLRRGTDERSSMLDGLAALYVRGCDVAWSGIQRAGRRVAIPTYRWQRERFWYGEDAIRGGAVGVRPGHALLGEPTSSPGGGQVFEATIDATVGGWLAEHRVQDVPVLPASAILEMALWASGEARGVTLESIEIQRAVRLDAGPVRLRLEVVPDGAGRERIRLSGRHAEAASWTVHASCWLRTLTESPARLDGPSYGSNGAGDGHDTDEHYAALSAIGIAYGPSFRGVERIRRTASGALAELRYTAPLVSGRIGFVVHPCLLDAALQTALAAVAGEDHATLVPVGFEAVTLYRSPSELDVLRCDARIVQSTLAPTADLTLADADGEVLVELRGVRFAPLAADVAGSGTFHALEWRPSPPAPDASGVSRRWLILSDRHGVGRALADRLQAAGDACTVLIAGDPAWPAEAAGATARATYDALIADTFADSTSGGVVHLRSLDESVEVDPARVAEGALPLDVAHLIAALASGESSPSRLVVVTAGVEAASSAGAAAVQSMTWGVCAVAASEHPRLACTTIDLPTVPEAEDIAALALLCRADNAERRIVVRGGMCSVARLARLSDGTLDVDTPLLAAVPESFRAEAHPSRTLDRLPLRAVERVAPGPGQVEIEVDACGLNFMNVLSALGTCPGYENGIGPLGIECAGRIARVGPDVTDLEPGDAVIAIAFDCLGTHAITDRRLVAPRPAWLGVDGAAALPIAFVTAAHALGEVGRLRAGEHVLIHSASGGVGLAAIQIALRLGAHVCATAGSPSKRAYLEALGIKHVFDSRTTEFAAGVLAATDGRGVDVVLNSLAGDAVAAGLSTLAPYGRFIEIGKRDIYDDATVGLAPFRRNLSYAAVDLDLMARERPDRVGELLRDAAARVAAGDLSPLPVHVYGIADAAEAFRTMASADHVGKLAISVSPAARREARVLAPPVTIRADASYLITGGTGALGLVAARTLVARGARHLTLLSRNPPSPMACEEITRLEAEGARIVALSADVSDAKALRAALDEVRRTLPPLRGTIHAAGVLDDATLRTLDGPRMRRVLGAKAAGAWLLHEITASDPLELFVLFSSAASLLGLAGQANYAAANASLDALARHRRALGLPATSIAWGPWTHVGMAAADPTRGERLAAQGLAGLSPDTGAAALDRLLETSRANVCAMSFNAEAWSRTHGELPLLELLRSRQKADATVSAIVRALGEAPVAERASLLAAHVAACVARVLRVDRANVPHDAPLRGLGLDSLLTLELRNRLESDLGLRLSATLVWNHPTTAALATHLLDALFPSSTGHSPDLTDKRPAPPPAETATDADLTALLTAELARVEALLGDAERRDARKEGRVNVA